MGSFQNLKRFKTLQQGSLAKKMVPLASRTFWEHGAREHLMVPGKIVKNVLAKKNWFLTAKNG